MTKPLSPVSQAVLDAAIDADGEESMHFPYEAMAAAVLRVAAYEILPRDSPDIEDFPEDDDDSPSDRIRHLKKRIRNKFLAIANELENQE